MARFLDRPELEAQLSAILLNTTDEVRLDITTEIKKEPLPTTIDQIDWKKKKRKIENDISAALLFFYLMSLNNVQDEIDPLSIDQSVILGNGKKWAANRADILAGQMVATMQKRSHEIVNKAMAEINDIMRDKYPSSINMQLPDATIGQPLPPLDKLQLPESQLVLDEMEGKLGDIVGEPKIDGIAKTEITEAKTAAEKSYVNYYEKQNQGYTLLAYWEHFALKKRNHPCPEICLPLEGKPQNEWPGIHPDKPEVWTGPPAHPNCVLPGQYIHPLGIVTGGAKSFYVGRCVEVCLASGRRFSVTAQHPILTRRGMVPAGELRQGVDLLCALRHQGVLPGIYPDDHDMPSLIEEVFRSCVESTGVMSVRVPVAAEDLHGEGAFIDGDIHVVNADRRVLSVPIGGSSRGPDQLLGIGPTTKKNATLLDSYSDSPSTDPGFAGQFVERFPGDISFDQLVKIRYFNYSGHVYDLQCASDGSPSPTIYTPGGLYAIDGAIVSNCDCNLDWKPITVAEAKALKIG